MFSSQSQARTIFCRTLFVAFCLVPTGVVLAYAVGVHTDAYRLSHERALAAAIGCQVELRGVSTPRPGVTLYDGLELVDAEMQQRLASFPCVEVERQGRGLLILFPVPAAINGERLEAFWEWAGERLRKFNLPGAHFEAGHLNVHLAGGALSLVDLSGELEHMPAQSKLHLEFRRAGDSPKSEPCRLLVRRIRQSHQPSVSVELTSGGSPLPVALVANLIPEAASLGPECTFAGEIRLSASKQRWFAHGQGTWDGIDLDQLLRGSISHHLSGRAVARLDKFSVRDGRLESATGRLNAGPGQISRSLVAAAEQHLALAAAPAATRGEGMITYEQLALELSLDEQGLVLGGGSQGDPACVLTAEGHRPLARTRSSDPQSVLNLLRTLVPERQYQVPAARETEQLARFLPLPTAKNERDVPTLKANTLDLKRK